MSGFFIRTAAERDLAAVSALLVETWHATYDPIYGPERVGEVCRSWHTIGELRPRLNRPNTEFLVADDGTRLAAMAYAAAGGSGTSVILHQLYVHPAFQRSGIGTELLMEIETCFPVARKIRVEVEEANAAAIGFVIRRGFLLSEPAAADLDGFPAPGAIYEKRLA